MGAVRQGAASGRPEHGGLLRLCLRPREPGQTSVQRQRFFRDGYRAGLSGRRNMPARGAITGILAGLHRPVSTMFLARTAAESEMADALTDTHVQWAAKFCRLDPAAVAAGASPANDPAGATATSAPGFGIGPGGPPPNSGPSRPAQPAP